MANLTTIAMKKLLDENNKSIFSRMDRKFEENNKAIFSRMDRKFEENNKKIESMMARNNKVLVDKLNKNTNERLSEAADAIVRTIDTFHDEANLKFGVLNKDVRDIKQDVGFIRQDIKDLTTEFSDKPSRKQFEEIKSKFDNFATL